MDCGPFTCAGSQCATTCATDTQCVPGFYCAISPPGCLAQKPSGAPCSANDQCLSGTCSLGTCL
jgi:hypothetical protein